MTVVLLALGLVLVVEGLAFALAPSRLDEVVALIARIPRDQRRLIGLGMLAAGVVLVWLARGALA
jgi:uncharacterized protein YjeT (DUF2065 family)